MKAQRTRDRILSAARQAFAERGYDGASVRSIAVAAGVDQALVHRYFGTKQELFLAATELPAELGAAVGRVLRLPDDQLGEGLVSAAVRMWDSEVSDALISTARTVIASPEGAPVVQDLLFGVILRELPGRIDRYGHTRRRVALVVTQMAGLLVARKLVGVEPIRSMPAEEVAALVGPTVQRYLTGDVDTPDADTPEPGPEPARD